MPLVEVRGLTKHFVERATLFGRVSIVRAVEGVSFAIHAGETFGLVGESGSGKTTVARCILRLVEPTAGEILFRGENVLTLPRERMRQLRRHMQIVFQDPFDSLNPRMTVGQSIEEPLAIHRIGSRASRRDRVAELLRIVGLEPAHHARYPHEFSGGQRQRVGLARALALDPSFVILDEAVSALDASVQAHVMALLLDLQARLSLTYLFIAHDLRLVEHVCSRLAVMYLGRIVEMGSTQAVFTSPHHAYTQALLSAIPVPDPDAPRRRVVLDAAKLRPGASLKEVGDDHFAAV